MIRAGLFTAALLIFGLPALAGGLRYQVISFGQLSGWNRDSHEQALRTFLNGCAEIRPGNLVQAGDSDRLCEKAGLSSGRAKIFFEDNFRPVVITDGSVPNFTGFFEPVLRGSREKTALYRYPLYRWPGDEQDDAVGYTRAQISDGAMDGRGLELVWLQSPIDAYYVHIQGSARFELTDGTTLRIGYAGRNNHSYRSTARALIDAGNLAPSEGTIEGMKAYYEADPEAGLAALNQNPSFIFFREIDLPDSFGPMGALQVPLTRGRSMAVDPDVVPLGLPVWVEVSASYPINRLMVAQDAGSDIRGAQRGDLFFGTGPEAGVQAEKVNARGAMAVLLPIASAERLLSAE